MAAKIVIRSCAKTYIRVRHKKIILTSFCLKKPSPTCQITNGTSGGIGGQIPWTQKGEEWPNCITKSQR